MIQIKCEVRGSVRTHEFSDIEVARQKWDEWNKYGLCISNRP